MSGVARSVVRTPQPSLNWVLPLLLIYLWFFMTTPFSRFPILTEVRFERILVAFVVGVAFVGGSFTWRMTSTTRWVLVLFGWMLVSWAFMPYKDFYLAEQWLDGYWKLVVFHLLFLTCLLSVRDVSAVLIGVAVISGLYQLHSWWDFVQGGSFVYQQGIKRIVGVWSESGKGAGNAFGFLALTTLPFVEYALRAVQKTRYKLVFLGIGTICLGSVVFSGTRAAFVGLLFFGILHLRSRATLRAGLLGLGALLVVLSLLPQDLKDRHATIFGISETEYAHSSQGETAIRSGRTRLEGLRDGFRIATKNPVLGVGPGASMLARFEINPTPFREGKYQMLQLHNLYGQVVSELGFPGLLVFGLLVLAFLRGLGEIRALGARADSGDANGRIEWIVIAMRQAMFLLLFYGLFAHTLYRYEWLLLFGLQGALLSILATKRPVGKPAEG